MVHGNYLKQDELEYLAAHRDNLSLIYCPRTHAYFGHDLYPLAQALEAGVAVAVGTDSRASNPNLSVWEELQEVATRHPQVSPQSVLELGTVMAARALGDMRGGTLAVGAKADLVSFHVGQREVADPHELLFEDGLLRPVVQLPSKAST